MDMIAAEDRTGLLMVAFDSALSLISSVNGTFIQQIS